MKKLALLLTIAVLVITSCNHTSAPIVSTEKVDLSFVAEGLRFPGRDSSMTYTCSEIGYKKVAGKSCSGKDICFKKPVIIRNSSNIHFKTEGKSIDTGYLRASIELVGGKVVPIDAIVTMPNPFSELDEKSIWDDVVEWSLWSLLGDLFTILLCILLFLLGLWLLGHVIGWVRDAWSGRNNSVSTQATVSANQLSLQRFIDNELAKLIQSSINKGHGTKVSVHTDTEGSQFDFKSVPVNKLEENTPPADTPSNTDPVTD